MPLLTTGAVATVIGQLGACADRVTRYWPAVPAPDGRDQLSVCYHPFFIVVAALIFVM